MKRSAFTKLWLLLMPFLFLSCEDKMDKHYDVPGWLRGSAWNVLEEEENYSIFLEGIELAGFKSLMQGKSIVTVMAPDDNAFKAYLTEQGYTGIDKVPAEELKALIGFHILYYSYNKEKLINFRPEGDPAKEEESVVDAGLYYKFRTRSANAPSTVQLTDKEITIYHLERFVPVFSYEMFKTKGIDAGKNYQYFYPNSTWTGSEGFNVSNASVKKYQLVADNGYIYTIDQVLKPLNTINDELKKRGDFSLFYKLYDSYSAYVYDSDLTSDYGKSIGVDSLYRHTHGNNLPPIAQEWPVSSYTSIKSNSSGAYTIFAPSNNALNEFFTKFWKQGGYTSLSDVDALIMNYLLLQFVYGGSILFPDELAGGKIENGFGVPFNIDPNTDISDREICVNGSFYGIKSMETPPLFSSVAGPVFKNKDARIFMYVLNGAAQLTPLVSQDVNYLVLVPTDDQFAVQNIFLKVQPGGNVVQVVSDEGTSNMGESTMRTIANLHIVDTKDPLPATGTKVYPTQLGFNYLYVKNGTITNNVRYNQLIDPEYSGNPFVTFRQITNEGTPWTNGNAYYYDTTDGIFQGMVSDTPGSNDGLIYALAINNDQRYPYAAFVQLLKKAGLVSGNTIPMLLVSNRFVSFIPTNDAVRAAVAANLIPGITDGSFAADGSLNVSNANLDATALNKYLCSYFLRASENVITTYPYPGSNMRSGSYVTANEGKILKYTDDQTRLSVQLEDGKVVKVIPTYDYFPFAFTDGCFHLIEDIL